MSLSFLKASRTVLLVSDQALYIYSTGSKGCQLIETVPWSVQDFEQNVATIISKDCGNNPVLILNDMVEQHYRKEKIPKVGLMDKANVVERKLLITFPSYPIRAAMPLKEKISKADKKTTGNIYIFAAAPASENFNKTVNAARQSSASITGFCLLPIESSDLVKKLSDKLFPKEKAKWTVFIGQHQSGGLRQIVTKNGELALTRMTPISESFDNPSQWVGEVFQEFTATMSYLSRFGFDSSEGLNLILVADDLIGEKFEESIQTTCNFKAITPSEAGKILGLNIGEENSDFYADEIHAAWAGTKSTFILPMKVKDLDRISRLRQFAVLLSLVLFFGLAFQMYQSFGYSQSLYSNSFEIDTSIKRKAELDIQYQKEVKRKEELGFDIQLIQSSLAVKKEFDEKDINLLELLYNVGMALPRDMRIDKMDVIRRQIAVRPGEVENQPSDLYEATLEMSFPSTMDAEVGNKKVEDLKTAIQKNMPDSVVKISKLLEDYQYSEGLVVQTGNVENKGKQQDYIAEIKIEKRLK